MFLKAFLEKRKKYKDKKIICVDLLRKSISLFARKKLKLYKVVASKVAARSKLLEMMKRGNGKVSS